MSMVTATIQISSDPIQTLLSYNCRVHSSDYYDVMNAFRHSRTILDDKIQLETDNSIFNFMTALPHPGYLDKATTFIYRNALRLEAVIGYYASRLWYFEIVWSIESGYADIVIKSYELTN